MRRSRSDEMPTDSGDAIARSRTLFSAAFRRLDAAGAATWADDVRPSGATSDNAISPSANDRKCGVMQQDYMHARRKIPCAGVMLVAAWQRPGSRRLIA